jgi:hypothetical protein
MSYLDVILQKDIDSSTKKKGKGFPRSKKDDSNFLRNNSRKSYSHFFFSSDSEDDEEEVHEKMSWKNALLQKNYSIPLIDASNTVEKKKQVFNIYGGARHTPKGKRSSGCKWCSSEKNLEGGKVLSWSCGCSLKLLCQRTSFCNRFENVHRPPGKKLVGLDESTGIYNIKRCVGCSKNNVSSVI